MFCKKCGAQNPDGAEKCQNCGFPLMNAPSRQRQENSRADAPVREEHTLDLTNYDKFDDSEDADQTPGMPFEARSSAQARYGQSASTPLIRKSQPSGQAAASRHPQKLYTEEHEDAENVSFWKMLLYHFLMLIPIVNIVLAIVLMTAGRTRQERTYGKAALCILLVLAAFVLAMVFSDRLFDLISHSLHGARDLIHAAIRGV